MFPVCCRICSIGGLGLDDAKSLVLSTAAEQDEGTRKAIEAAIAADKDGGKSMEAAAERMGDAIKDRAIKNAVISAGIQLSVMAIPGVGQAISGVIGGITAISAKKYTEKLKRHIESKTAWLEDYVAKKEKALNTALNDAYDAAYKKAPLLARSWQKLETGPDEGVFNQSFDGMGDIVDKVTGRDVYSKGRDMMNKLVADAVKQIDAAADPIIKKVKQPAFRTLMAKKIAIEMRNEPGFLAMVAKDGAPPPTKFTGVVAKPTIPVPPATDTVEGGESPDLPMTPILIGGAVLAAVLLLR